MKIKKTKETKNTTNRMLHRIGALGKEKADVLFLFLPFILIDVCIRIIGRDIHYFQAAMVLPNLIFNLIWIVLVTGLSISIKQKAGKIVYLISFGISFVLFLVNAIYYSLTGFFFSFNLIFMAGEGSSYILDAVIHANPLIYLMAVVILASAVLACRKFPKRNRKAALKNVLILLAGFVILHLLTPFLLGKESKTLEWDNWRNPRNVYSSFNDANKCMKICGIYEYTFRDFYLTFLGPEDEGDKADLDYLKKAYENPKTGSKNEYTGMFKGKNVIFLQLEGIDDWLLTEKDMPNLYSLMKHSMVFDEHYSYYNGGGSTFNSELAVNTGLITPVSYTQNAYTFNRNRFDHSLAKLFGAQGYAVNAFHMNTEEYYSRGINYKNWGYDDYYGLLDRNSYKDLKYEFDRELILNEEFYQKMFQSGEKFLHYIITYTPHTPFTTQKGMGKQLAEDIYEGKQIPDLSEEESARMYAGETDRMIGLLMKALEDNNLLNDTVIAAFSDHYLYTLNDKSILEQYKQTNNNLINHTPFFIWSSDMKPQKIEKVNSQIDILPTILNLFGIEYISDYYIGNDIFDKNYTGYAFFSDYSWYDGNVYVEDGAVTNGGKIDEKELNRINTKINNLIRKNDLTLKYDYFRKIETKDQ
ncbi:MAG: sulfatase-like hydrolase/transferase [Lachnospiraceae bacterium]|nr:sulfatase-like hydrolase/transferase [Lachnospiraceae bacterium]